MAKGIQDGRDAVKKVERAAQTAGQRESSVQSRMGYPALIGLIIVLGIAFVTYAKVTRADEQKPVQNRDHWHAVYGVWDCTANSGSGGYLPPFQSTLDEEGIHSHQDGIIHIHPWFDSSDGPDAQLQVFNEAMQIEMRADGMTLDDGSVLANGASCGDGEAQLHIRKWQFDFVSRTADPEIITTDLDQVQFLNDREVYVIAFAPLDAEIPLPPDDRFEQLNAVAGVLQSSGPIASDEPAVTFDVEQPADASDADDAVDTDTDGG